MLFFPMIRGTFMWIGMRFLGSTLCTLLLLFSQIASAETKSTNIHSNLVALAFGFYQINLDVGFADRFTIGPMVTYRRMGLEGSNTNLYGLGIESNLYLSGPVLTDSWVLSGLIEYSTPLPGSLAEFGITIGGNLQYRWFWNSGFNVGLGVGAGKTILDYRHLGMEHENEFFPITVLDLGFSC